MAIGFIATGAGIKRITGSFLSGNANFTIMYWMFTTGVVEVANPDYRTFHALVDSGSGDYLGLFSVGDEPQFAFTTNIGAGSVSSEYINTIRYDAYHICYVYDNTAKTLKLYINKSLVETITIDYSSSTFNEEYIGDDGGFSVPGDAIQNYRSWQRALTQAQICAEAGSNNAVLATNLFCDTPLSTASDLTDDSGNARNWSSVGSPVDYITNDLKFIGASPPVNIDALTAIDIPFYNYHTVQKVDDSGTTYTVWYKYTSPIDGVIGVWAWGDDTIFSPRIDAYGPDDSTLHIISFGPNLPGQLIVRAGKTYYFRVVSNASNPTPASLTFSVLPAPADPISLGDILVNNDTPDLSAVVIGGLGEGIIQFQIDFPAGEQGDSILSPIPYYVVTDVSDGTVKAFNRLFVELSSFVPVGYHGQEPRIRANPTLELIYVLTNDVSNSWALQSVDELGAASAVIDTLTINRTSAQIKAFAVNNPGERVYLGDGNLIKVWDLTTHALLPTFASGPVSHTVYDLLVLTNDHVVALWIRSSTGSIQVIEYDTAGSVVYTNDWGTDNVHSIFQHIAYSRNDPTRYWLWSHPLNSGDEGLSRFREVTTSTGVAAVDSTIVEFESETYSLPATPIPLARFGNSFSCPFFLVVSLGTTATIIVNKVRVGGSEGDSFDFTTSGGLTPSTFSLEDEGEQVYDGLAPGTYGITEDAKANYTPEYAVSNGDDHASITVADGDVVTVTVTNTFAAENILSGIYKVVPRSRKSNDTIYVSLDPEVTEDVEIPDPFWKTGLVGE